jgi:hypothetical protein
MNAKKLVEILSKLRENDVLENGEDSEGNINFAVRLPNGIASLTLNSYNESDFEDFD